MFDKTALDTLAALSHNGFNVYQAADPGHAAEIILSEITPAVAPRVVSYGDSLSVRETGVLDVFRQDPGIEFIDTFEEGVDRGELIERRRRALTCDLFFTGANALTGNGKLVNLDMVGNRVAGLIFGPRQVVVVAGANKIVPDANAGVRRIREVAGPQNAARHGARTPCAKTGRCMDCKSPDRICNVWTITDKCWPKGRIHVVLVDGSLGL
ncbi:lactate utilization protein [Pseudodesulfovibrio sp.]|uniref:lactate utilization protein n=1 Tax=Pseudodesulfovibrio sp. TaxID=2035812 RepID=UPI002632CEBD|nr:lactate utilization protein [Pseudodesulfovibrio sp.]MDD3313170.1 lactate utilization protein [Pseudodesulfovibrio sp.]